jgi:hypothetical protein
MFDNRLRTRKRELGMDQKPDTAKDDEGYAVMLQMTDPEELKNYFRYDATISRDYYRAIATLEKMQAARRKAQAATVHPDHVQPEPRRDREGALSASQSIQPTKTTRLNSIGFVSHGSIQKPRRSGPRSAKIGFRGGQL